MMDSPIGWPGTKNSLNVPETGWTSSCPQANCLYPFQACRNSFRIWVAAFAGGLTRLAAPAGLLNPPTAARPPAASRADRTLRRDIPLWITTASYRPDTKRHNESTAFCPPQDSPRQPGKINTDSPQD